MAQSNNQLSLDDVIVKVTNMVSYDSNANILAKNVGYNINYVSWEDCARNKFSTWGPCISDMTLKVNNSCMPVIRKPNYSDITWDVPMNKIPIVIGNETSNPNDKLQTISLTDYLSNFSVFMSNPYYKNALQKHINLTSPQDTHVIMSSQTCFLPIQSGQETKFNVALFNYESEPKNPAVLVIVSTAQGTSAQIIEGKEQYLLFNNNGKKADFTGQRVSDYREQKGQKHNLDDQKLSKEEKQDNVIVIVQVPLKKKKPVQNRNMFDEDDEGFQMFQAMNSMCIGQSAKKESAVQSVNVEAAMVKVSERTKPVCVCNKELTKYQVRFAYSGDASVSCDMCKKSITGKETLLYHCKDGKNWAHANGYDLCIGCGEEQLRFDELRGMIETDPNYVLARDERFPVRCTLQYYKATDNGAVDQEIMNGIVQQLESSQKMAEYMGSLVTEYKSERPSEWVHNIDTNEDIGMNARYKEIMTGLKNCCGEEWNIYYKHFIDEEVTDYDLKGLSMDDLKELIPKIGPRNRFKKWMDLRNRKPKPNKPMPFKPKPMESNDKQMIADSFVGRTYFKVEHAMNANGVYISDVLAIAPSYRILYPGTPMTMDYRQDRLNIHLERQTNIITAVVWG